MPISEYFKGHGSEVMKKMQEKYGAEHGKEVFYATANKTGMKAAFDSALRSRLHQALDRICDAMGDEHLGFSKLKNELAHKKGVENPGAVAAKIGMEKYGKGGMERKTAAGRAKDLALFRALDALERQYIPLI